MLFASVPYSFEQRLNARKCLNVQLTFKNRTVSGSANNLRNCKHCPLDQGNKDATLPNMGAPHRANPMDLSILIYKYEWLYF